MEGGRSVGVWEGGSVGGWDVRVWEGGKEGGGGSV